jgi:hypothetical protein
MEGEAMSDQIKPRVDETGVPWCTKMCPNWDIDFSCSEGTVLCLPAIRAMSKDAALGRRVRMMSDGCALEFCGGQWIVTIEGRVVNPEDNPDDAPEAALKAAGIGTKEGRKEGRKDEAMKSNLKVMESALALVRWHDGDPRADEDGHACGVARWDALRAALAASDQGGHNVASATCCGCGEALDGATLCLACTAKPADAYAAGRAEALREVAGLVALMERLRNACANGDEHEDEMEALNVALRALVAGQPVEKVVRVADVRALADEIEDSPGVPDSYSQPCVDEWCKAMASKLRRLCGLEVR